MKVQYIVQFFHSNKWITHIKTDDIEEAKECVTETNIRKLKNRVIKQTIVEEEVKI